MVKTKIRGSDTLPVLKVVTPLKNGVQTIPNPSTRLDPGPVFQRDRLYSAGMTKNTALVSFMSSSILHHAITPILHYRIN